VQLELLDLESNKIKSIDITVAKESKALELLVEETGLYLFYKKNSNYLLSKLEDGKLIDLTEFKTGNISLGKRMFFINKFAIYKTEGMKGFLNQSVFNVEASKLVTFFTDESEKIVDYEFTTIESKIFLKQNSLKTQIYF
jgi:hypothetical protein